VVAVDIPSGVSGESGEVLGECVMADVTVTMAYPKLGHFLYPGRHFVGDLVVADIGASSSLAKGKVRTYLLDREEMRSLIPPRLGPEHKGDFGRVLTLAGSKGYTGAATLSAQAALRVGAGLSYLALPGSLNAIAETKATEVITLPLSENDGVITERAAQEVLSRDISFDVIAAGPGLTRSEGVRNAVKELLTSYAGPLVLDADGVVVLKENLKALGERGGETVLTPHPGELGALLGRPGSEISKERVTIARDFATKYGVVLVLKGAPTVVGTPEGDVWLNSTGNPGLAKGGAGDVLTGLIAGLIGQGLGGEDAALLGVYLHGLSGDLAALDQTEHCVMAEDLLDYLPDSFDWLLDGGEDE
jgi:NAD(P)H-hydrate epimerase